MAIQLISCKVLDNGCLPAVKMGANVWKTCRVQKTFILISNYLMVCFACHILLSLFVFKLGIVISFLLLVLCILCLAAMMKIHKHDCLYWRYINTNNSVFIVQLCCFYFGNVMDNIVILLIEQHFLYFFVFDCECWLLFGCLPITIISVSYDIKYCILLKQVYSIRMRK